MTLVKPRSALRTSRVRCEDCPATMIVRARSNATIIRGTGSIVVGPHHRAGSIAPRRPPSNTYFCLRAGTCLARRPIGRGATAIIMRTSSASEPASIFCMTCARWISTVRWLTPRSPATILFALPCVTRSSTSRSRGLSVARRSRIRSVRRRRPRLSVSRTRARCTRSSSSWSRNGFCRKSNAPCCMASTAIGMSPCPVMKITGRVAPRRLSSCCISRPLMPGMRTSSTRHPGCAGS